MNSKLVRFCIFSGMAAALITLTGCLEEVTEAARGALPFLPPSKYIDRGGRKLTRAEAAYYQKLTDLSKATKVNPHDAVAFNAIGELLASKGALSLAKRCFQDAVDFDPTLSEPHHNLGRVFLLEERYHGAMEELEKARKLSGDDAKIRVRLGQAHAAQDHFAEALAEFNEAIALDNEYTPAYLEKARMLYSQHSYPEAAEACREALAHIPPYIPPPAARSTTGGSGLLDKLLPANKLVEDETPPPTYKEEASYDLALCLKAQGQYGEALSALLGAETAKDGRADIQILKAKLQDLMGDSNAAIGTLSLLRTANPEMAEVPKLVARLQDKLGQSDLAAKTRLDAAELDQADKELQIEAVRDAEAKHNRPRMITLYERIVRIDPENLQFRIALAQTYEETSIKREAALAWQEVINLRERILDTQRRDGVKAAVQDPFLTQPAEYDVRRRTGMLYADIPGMQGRAVLHFLRCIELVPNDGEVQRRLGKLYLATKKYDEAERHIRVSLRLMPDDAQSHHNLATLEAEQSRYDDAVLEYQKAIKLDPKLDLAYLNLAKLLLGQNRREEALEPLRMYTKLQPLDIESRRRLADLYRDLNNRQAALAELEAVFALETENGGEVEDMLKTVQLKWDMGEKQNSLSDIETQIEKHPADLRLLLAAGRKYSELKMHIRAIYTWQRILSIVPSDTNPPVRNEALARLAAEYFEIGKKDDAIKTSEAAGKGGDPEGWRRAAEMHLKVGNPEKACDAFREVIKAKPQDLDARRQLAALIQSSPQIMLRREATKLYEELVQLMPEDERAHVNLGNLYSDFNRFSEAQDQYEAVLRQNPKNTSAIVGHGVVFRKRGRYKEALDDYLKAIEADPKLSIGYFNAALVYDYYLVDREKAKLYYAKFIENGGDPAKLPQDATVDPSTLTVRPQPPPVQVAPPQARLNTAPAAEIVEVETSAAAVPDVLPAKRRASDASSRTQPEPLDARKPELPGK